MPDIASSSIRMTDDTKVEVLSIDRAHAANSLTLDLVEDMARRLVQADAHVGTLGVVLTGAGERVFCAGIDLGNPDRLPAEALRQYRRRIAQEALRCILSFGKPLVVALNGKAVGMGGMIAVLGDRLVLSERSALSFPEVRIGIPPILGLSIFENLYGSALAADVMLSGRTLGAAEASDRHIGQLVEGTGAVEAAAKAVRDLAGEDGSAFRTAKSWLNARRLRRFEQAIAESMATHT